MPFTIRRQKDLLEGSHATLREALTAARAAYEPAREALVIERDDALVAAKMLPGSGSVLVKSAFLDEALS